MNPGNSDTKRCGYVAFIGAPNAGKSTLVNFMTGAKVSIVSPKPQTTRIRVLGIILEDNTQLILVDTPGIFNPRRKLDETMVAEAWKSASDADVVALMVDAVGATPFQVNADIISKIKESGRKAVLVLNKVDAIQKEKLLTLAEEFNASEAFSDIFMISARTGDGVDKLRKFLAAKMPEGEWLYPEDQMSDMPLRILAAEITREKLYLQLRQELPYASMVETEKWEELEDGSVRISQVIYVEREGQKPIVLGKGGSRIKSIGTAARLELEEILGHRVHLLLFVKVRPDWAETR